MATFITVGQGASAELLNVNRTQTAANRLSLERQSKQIAEEPLPLPTQVNPSRRPAVAGDELAAFRRRGFSADFLVLSYQFFTGEDLDTRTSLYLPTTQTVSDDVGWSRKEIIEVVSGDPIVTWAGDNTDNGYESVLVDVGAYRRAFPESREIILRTAAFWYDIKGGSVALFFVGYKGGLMILQPEQFNWINPTALRTYDTYPSYTTNAVTTNISDNVDGDFIAYVYFRLDTGRMSYQPLLPS